VSSFIVVLTARIHDVAFPNRLMRTSTVKWCWCYTGAAYLRAVSVDEGLIGRQSLECELGGEPERWVLIFCN
jgi:hypothetical protein